MNPEDFLSLARELYLKGNEAALRSATSRAYYAAFHKSREMLTSMNIRVGTGAPAHGDISRYLQYSEDRSVTAAGVKLDSLRSMRNKADYDLNTKRVATRSNTDFQLSEAQKIIDVLLGATKSDSYANKIRTSIQTNIGKLEAKSNNTPQD